jgi:Mg/Co/Ni transporter MgtE
MGRVIRKEVSTSFLIALTLGLAGCLRAWMMLPPVPISNGMKKASAMADSSASSKCCSTLLV